MTQQVINLGATGSGAGGDSARTAFEKAIANFAELYIAALPGTAAQKQAARDMFGLGSAATRAAQSSATDTTAGALMAVGAFGLGGRSNNVSHIAGYPQTLDESISQIYRRTDEDMGVPGYAAGIHFGAANTWGRLRVSYNSTRAWVQGGAATAGTGWTEELFHTGNILGTVSQSGGVPTGAIIERGSNANGEYVRWADGTQWCMYRVQPGSATGFVTKTHAAAFSNPNYVVVGNSDGSSSTTGITVKVTSRTVTSFGYAAIETSGNTLTTASTSMIAMGQWN